MADLPSLKARRVLSTLEKLGFRVVRTRGSHRFLRHPDGCWLVFSFHDRETLGPRILAKILKDAAITMDEFLRRR